MSRLPSLAAGISGAGFEWNPSPARTPSPTPSDLNTESHLTFASTKDSSSRPAQSTAQSQADTSAEASTSQDPLHEGSHEDTAGDAVAVGEAENSSMSADTIQQEEARAGSFSSAMQTKAPGLTPLRLTPKTEPAQPRSAQSCLRLCLCLRLRLPTPPKSPPHPPCPASLHPCLFLHHPMRVG